jgi:hypothetical protein
VRVTLPVAHGLRVPSDQVTVLPESTHQFDADTKFNSGASGSTIITSIPVAALVLAYHILHTTTHHKILVGEFTDLVIVILSCDRGMTTGISVIDTVAESVLSLVVVSVEVVVIATLLVAWSPLFP